MKQIFENAYMYFPMFCQDAIDIYENGPFELILVMDDETRWSYYDFDNTIRKLPKGPELTEEEYRYEFGIRLSDILYRLGISQGELSEMTGIGYVSISRYINGSATPSFSNASKIARALRISLDAFTYVPINNSVKHPFRYYEEIDH